jgi:hypothetical protein
MLVFWTITPCGHKGTYQRFGGTYLLHLQPCSSETRWFLPASTRGITTLKTNIDVFTATRTPNLT